MKIKKLIYVCLTVILGILLSFIAHSVIEVIYLKYALNNNLTIGWNNYPGVVGCALPFYLQLILPLAGAIGGYFLGQYWWRIIYIEKCYLGFKKSIKSLQKNNIIIKKY